MQAGADASETQPPRINRRQMIVGTGVAAAAWAAPTVLHLDLASAQGSTSGSITVTPNSLPSNVTPMPNVIENTAGTSTFGQFGRGDGSNMSNIDNGPVFTLAFNGVPAHTMVSGTVVICYEGDWESGGGGGDTMDVRIGGMSFAGFPTSNVGVGGPQCIMYTLDPMSHTATTFDLVFEGVVTAIPEDFGIASVTLNFT